MLLSEYINFGSVLDDKGVFDPILDKDSPFFINILRLKNAQTPEFRNSYSNINEYFRKIIKLLSKAQSKSKMVYVFIDLGSPIKRQKLLDLYNRNVDEGKEMPHLIVVDAAKKHSASIL